MKKLVIFCITCALCGCGTSPPRPPECSGPLVPINTAAEQP